MNKQFWILFLIGHLSYNSRANIGPQGFGEFPNYYFIETGTSVGNGIAIALKVEAFKEIRSMEIHPNNVAYAKRRFLGNPRVKIVLGDSSKDLWNLIKDLDKPATFWLDGHVYPAQNNGKKNCPLMEELDQIKRHPIKTHTILIDDMHCCGDALFDFLTKEDIIKKVLEVNPDYQISYVDGGDDGSYKNNIMVARIP